MTEEEGDHEDHQEYLGEHEHGDADPEADADFLFEVHGQVILSRSVERERHGDLQSIG